MSRGRWKPATIEARLPSGAAAEKGIGDPANGARVPRCRCCGRPDRPEPIQARYRLHPGLWGYIRTNVGLTLCGACIGRDVDDDECRLCGLADRPGIRLIVGNWGYIRWNLPLTLCEKCVIELMPHDPRDADPLTLDDVA